ncbi:7-cyano-7-deazaguanine synthase [Bacillus infantis]|uniref:7-cyano-7-deazaguanine synthase n=1 Tax=Bacillus infantis TaxID=324767 RepID=UPI003017AB71
MESNINSSSILVLMSGGIDSTALIHYYLSKNYRVKCLHFQYSQDSFKSELEAVDRISEYYGVEVEIIKFGFPFKNNHGEYRSRNAIFILTAANLLASEFAKIGIGIHRGTPYYDCSEVFLNDCQKIIDGYFRGTLTIDAPFLQHTKEQVYRYCIENKIPTSLTFSCENSNDKPCGSCPSCEDRRLLNEVNSL